MGFKASSVLDVQTESGFARIAGKGLVGHEWREPTSVAAIIDEIVSPVANDDLPLHLEGTTWHDSDHYQVALVPLGNMADRVVRNSRLPLEVRPVLVLPLTWKELVTHLRQGRATSGSDNRGVRFGEVSVNFFSMEVTRSEETVVLTAMEFKLLRFLAQNPGRVVSREEILNEVWGYENYPCTRTVDNHILKLRQKLELDPARPIHFQTVHGVGYKFVIKASPVVAELKM